jgi:hypothetical protein
MKMDRSASAPKRPGPPSPPSDGEDDLAAAREAAAIMAVYRSCAAPSDQSSINAVLLRELAELRCAILEQHALLRELVVARPPAGDGTGKLVPLKEAAKRLGLHEDTTLKFAKQCGAAYKEGGRWLIDMGFRELLRQAELRRRQT